VFQQRPAGTLNSRLSLPFVPTFPKVDSSPAKTPIDTGSGSDVGNFLGVAIYVEGQEVVLISEMEAVGTGIAVSGVFMQRRMVCRALNSRFSH
jgi:hypothetical protein